MKNVEFTLYHMPHSRSDRVLWTLHELNLINQTVVHNIDILKGEQRQLVIFNQMAQVPVLIITHTISGEQTVMTESCAIVAFLCEQYKSLSPTHDNFQQRAQYHRMMSYAATTLDDLVFTVFRNERLFPEEKRDAKVAAHARHVFSKRARCVVEESVKEGWIIGGEFTGADICVGYILIFAVRLGMIDESTVLQEYVRKCKMRAAFQSMIYKIAKL